MVATIVVSYNYVYYCIWKEYTCYWPAKDDTLICDEICVHSQEGSQTFGDNVMRKFILSHEDSVCARFVNLIIYLSVIDYYAIV